MRTLKLPLAIALGSALSLSAAAAAKNPMVGGAAM